MLRYVHGSEDSLDVDVFYVFDEMPSFKECQEFCANKEENRNIIVVKDGVVVDCFKGTVDEINNGLYYTYSLHRQECENVIQKPVERDVLIKAIRALRCLLSHCSKTQYRSEVKRALKSSSWKEKIKVTRSIDFASIDDYSKHGTLEDIYKIFAFQLGQIFGLVDGVELFTKSSVANMYPQLRKYLYREKNSDIGDLVYYIQEFLDVISNYRIEEQNGITRFVDFNKSIDLVKEQYVL